MELRRKISILTIAAFLACGLPARAEEVSSCALLYTRLSGQIKSLPQRLRDWAIQYKKEVRENPWRVLIRANHISAEPETLMAKTVRFMGNPFATTFRRPRQLTIPVTMAGWVGADIGIEYFNAYAEERNIAAAEKLLTEFPPPGGRFAKELAEAGLISRQQMAEIISHHWNTLERWRDSPGTLTPRLAEILSRGWITVEQAQATDAEMRRIYSGCEKQRDRSCWENLEPELGKNLKKLPEFQGASPEQGALVTTSFFPRVEITSQTENFLTAKRGSRKKTDLDLVQALNAADGESDPMGAIATLLDNHKINYRDALAMAFKALDDPSGQKQKQERAKTILPPSKLYLANRPDLAGLVKNTEFAGQKLSSELDYWSLLQKDPRFASLRQPWESGKLDDTLALRALEAQVRGRAGFALVDKQFGSAAIDEDTAMVLFGVGSPKTMNPLLVEPKTALATLVSEGDKEQTKLKTCMVKIADFWRHYYADETALLEKQGPEKFPALWNEKIKSKGEEYQRTQASCLE